MNYSSDYKSFLKNLDQEKNKIIYARITLLNFAEAPIEQIEGRVTQGSINIDGASTIRRSCSLTLVAKEYNYNWELNTKFKLEIGVENQINSKYPKIIWFPQGIYVLTTFNTAKTVNNFSISVQGKDKMCLLNGEVGGSLESNIDFGTIEEENSKGEWITRKLTIIEIIRNMVHTYGGEPYHNIIINDLDTYGLELLEYRYDIPLFLYRKSNSYIYTNILLENNDTTLYTSTGTEKKLKELNAEYLESLTETLADNSQVVKPLYSTKDRNKEWYFTKVEYGQTAGYRITDLTYAGDLIANIGESITSILDKIKNMLVEFEYFYDLEGHFVFQKKKSFISTMWAPSSNDDYIDTNIAGLNSSYSFQGSNLITAFNNNPNLNNVRNDYSIWGERIASSGITLPVHLRYAIDKKPIQYTQIIVDEEELISYNKKYGTTLFGRNANQVYTYVSSNEYQIDEQNHIIKCDWREVLYQMALDYYKYNHLDNFELKIIEANKAKSLYVNGQTGYEPYYIDLQGFWRQLYYPDINQAKEDAIDQVEKLTSSIESIHLMLYGTSDSNGIKTPGLVDKISRLNTLIEENSSSKNEYAGQLANDYNINVSGDNYANKVLIELQNKFQTESSLLKVQEIELDKAIEKQEKLETECLNYYSSEEENSHWNKNVFEAPETLNFWFDFLDTNGTLSQFSTFVIGNRPKAVNDSTIKSIYFRETPSVVFQESGSNFEHLGAYKSIQVPNIENMFSVSAQGKSAKERLDELLYQHSYCIENVTINAIPVYYLQPNTRIYINDEETNICGDYIINKITLPLTYNGTMSITAIKAAKDIL